MPYIFSDNVPSYDSVRDNVKVYYGIGAANRMMQIRIINDMVNGIPYEDINIEYPDEVPDYVISGEDYYIEYSNGNINTFILDSCKENKKTIDEVDMILKENIDMLGINLPKGVSR